LFQVRVSLDPPVQDPVELISDNARRAVAERIPLTIADKDAEKDSITLVWHEVGVTTYYMGAMCVGDRLQDLCGPLGKPTHIENFGTVVGVGGGIGVAPLFPITKGMKQAGNHVISIIGARTEGLLIMTEDMRQVSHELLISTDEGSFGIHGFVTQLLQGLIDKGTKIDLVVAIGPAPMMRAVVKVTKNANLPTVVSLNPIMVDGAGMCGGMFVKNCSNASKPPADAPIATIGRWVSIVSARTRAAVAFRGFFSGVEEGFLSAFLGGLAAPPSGVVVIFFWAIGVPPNYAGDHVDESGALPGQQKSTSGSTGGWTRKAGTSRIILIC
jgi:ferredoxin--NADP+ reductase